MKREDMGKYLSFLHFMKFLFEVKTKTSATRTDYYSTKTFCALKNSSEQDLTSLTSILKKIFTNICKAQKFFMEEEISKNKGKFHFVDSYSAAHVHCIPQVFQQPKHHLRLKLWKIQLTILELSIAKEIKNHKKLFILMLKC